MTEKKARRIEPMASGGEARRGAAARGAARRCAVSHRPAGVRAETRGLHRADERRRALQGDVVLQGAPRDHMLGDAGEGGGAEAGDRRGGVRRALRAVAPDRPRGVTAAPSRRRCPQEMRQTVLEVQRPLYRPPWSPGGYRRPDAGTTCSRSNATPVIRSYRGHVCGATSARIYPGGGSLPSTASNASSVYSWCRAAVRAIECCRVLTAYLRISASKSFFCFFRNTRQVVNLTPSSGGEIRAVDPWLPISGSLQKGSPSEKLMPATSSASSGVSSEDGY